jgi:RNA polymerase sigma factor (sigma-70 family)
VDAAKLDRWLRRKARGDEDLVQVGWVAVMEAVPDYDASRGCSFETFAFRRALAHMANHRRRYRNAVTTPPDSPTQTFTQSETSWGDSLVESLGSADLTPEELLERQEQLFAMFERLRRFSDGEQKIVAEWLKTGDKQAVGKRLRIPPYYVRKALQKMLRSSK